MKNVFAKRNSDHMSAQQGLKETRYLLNKSAKCAIKNNYNLSTSTEIVN